MRICSVLFAMCLVSFVAPPAGADQASSLAAAKDAIAKAVSAERSFEHEFTDETVKALSERAAACVLAIDDAIKAGNMAKTDVEIDTWLKDKVEGDHDERPGGSGMWITLAPLGEVRKHCDRAADRPWISTAAYRVTDAVRAVEGLEGIQDLKQKSNQADVLSDYAPKCVAEIKQAAAVLDADTELDTKAGKVKLKDAPKYCQAVADAVEKVRNEAQAALLAELEPYRKVLKDDKLAVFEEKFGIDAYARGKGGELLSEPADYANHSVWFATYTYDGELCGNTTTHWRLERFEFKGHKLKGKMRESTGCGEDPPTKAYK